MLFVYFLNVVVVWFVIVMKVCDLVGVMVLFSVYVVGIVLIRISMMSFIFFCLLFDLWVNDMLV